MLMAQALEKIFLQKVAQMPQEEVELLPPAPKGKGRKPAAGTPSAGTGEAGGQWALCPWAGPAAPQRLGCSTHTRQRPVCGRGVTRRDAATCVGGPRVPSPGPRLPVELCGLRAVVRPGSELAWEPWEVADPAASRVSELLGDSQHLVEILGSLGSHLWDPATLFHSLVSWASVGRPELGPL